MGKKRMYADSDHHMTNPFMPVIGAKNIAPYFGISVKWWEIKYRDDILSYGLMWRVNDRPRAMFMSSPFLINLYFVIKAKEELEKQNE
jgi:hypothetical protein